MDLQLTDRKVVITGAAGRLGSVLSREFARAGADVVMLDIDPKVHRVKREVCSSVESAISDEELFDASDGVDREDSSEETAMESESESVETGQGKPERDEEKKTKTDLKEDRTVVVSRECDITAYESVTETLSDVRDRLGRTDILVNNAAITDSFSELDEYENEMWREDIETNLTGAYNMIRAIYPEMCAQEWGRIVTIASMAGEYGAVGRASYAASKAGVVGLAKTAALEGGRDGVTSNVVALGLVANELADLDLDELEGMRGRFDSVAENTAVGRIGREMDVAPLVVFLSSPLAGYITGQVYQINGGANLG